MSIEAYEEMTGRFELYGLIKERLDDVAESNTRSFSEAMSSIRSKLHITSAAERDLNRTADHIEFVLKNPQAADDLLDEAEQQIL